MNTKTRTVIVLALGATVAATLVAKNIKREKDGAQPAPAEAAQEETAPLPRLVDLGADKCVPCKMMVPVLEELEKGFSDTFTVEFIDVWKNPDAGEQYEVRMIPTQIFYDRDGEELFRHEGFFSKEEILAKWKEHGIVAAPTDGQ